MSRETRGENGGTATEWPSTKALMEANAASMRALEEYLYFAQNGDDHPPESVVAHVDRAIDRHRRVIEDLQFVKETLEADAVPTERTEATIKE
jgi:hypothetical protein